MARPREFEADVVLQHAMQIFWDKGYQATSIGDLVEQTGTSRYGLYAEFGDKHDLFLKALDLYYSTGIESMVSPLETEEAGFETIRSYFARLVEPLEQGQHASGCLIGNTALELDHPPEEIAARIRIYFDRLQGAFANAITNSVQQQTLSPKAEVSDLASYLVGVVHGYLGMLRTTTDPQAIRAFVWVALRTLD